MDVQAIQTFWPIEVHNELTPPAVVVAFGDVRSTQPAFVYEWAQV